MKTSLLQKEKGTWRFTSIFLLFLLFFPFVFAATNTPDATDVFSVNEVVRYTKPCINNGSYCSSSATCNYTFYDRDNSIRVNNDPGTSVGLNGASLWEYNISHTETGVYKVEMVCVDGSAKGSETIYYQVSGDGNNLSIGFYILIVGVSFLIIILGFFLRDPWVVVLGTFGLYFVGIYTLIYGIAGFKDLTTTFAVGIILLFLAAYISIKSLWEVIET